MPDDRTCEDRDKGWGGFTIGSVETGTKGSGISKEFSRGWERKNNTRFWLLISVVPVLPDCAPRPQDGTGAFKKCEGER